MYVMDADGGNVRQQLTEEEGNFIDLSPIFSSDGEQILFHRNAKLFVMDVDGPTARLFTELDELVLYTDLSPDGKQIALSLSDKDDEGSDIYVMDADGTNVRQLTDNDHDDTSPGWSSDGKQIAFTSDRYGDDKVLVMDADGTNIRDLNQSGRRPSYKP